MIIKVKTIDGADPVGMTMDEIKDHLWETSTDQDSTITFLSKVAREFVEGETWKQIIPATLTLYLDQFPDGIIEINRPPIISIDSVKYYDGDQVLQTVAVSDYEVDINGETGRLRPDDSWPATYDQLNAVEVEFQAGYDGSNAHLTLPEKLKQAMMFLIKHWYDNRDTIVVSEGRSLNIEEVPLTVKALLAADDSRVFV